MGQFRKDLFPLLAGGGPSFAVGTATALAQLYYFCLLLCMCTRKKEKKREGLRIGKSPSDLGREVTRTARTAGVCAFLQKTDSKSARIRQKMHHSLPCPNNSPVFFSPSPWRVGEKRARINHAGGCARGGGGRSEEEELLMALI